MWAERVRGNTKSGEARRKDEPETRVLKLCYLETGAANKGVQRRLPFVRGSSRRYAPFVRNTTIDLLEYQNGSGHKRGVAPLIATSIRITAFCGLLFGGLLFGGLLFGRLLFGRLLFGRLLFGRLLFGRLLFGCRFRFGRFLGSKFRHDG